MDRVVSSTEDPKTVTRPYPRGVPMPPMLDDDLLELCEMSMDGPQSPMARGCQEGGDEGTIIMGIGDLLELQKTPTDPPTLSRQKLADLPDGHPRPEADALQLRDIAQHGVRQVSSGVWLLGWAIVVAGAMIFLG